MIILVLLTSWVSKTFLELSLFLFYLFVFLGSSKLSYLSLKTDRDCSCGSSCRGKLLHHHRKPHSFAIIERTVDRTKWLWHTWQRFIFSKKTCPPSTNWDCQICSAKFSKTAKYLENSINQLKKFWRNTKNLSVVYRVSGKKTERCWLITNTTVFLSNDSSVFYPLGNWW